MMNLPSASNDAVQSPDDLKRKLGQTVASDQFTVNAVQASSAESAAAIQAVPGAAPLISGPSLIDRLHARAHPGMAGANERFQVRNLIGTGATARVYAVVDRDLKREVAVKILEQSDPQDIDHFLEEAQIAASLEHPNVLPVHDIDVNASGQVYFTMKRIEGQSLGGELACSSRDERSPRIRSFNSVVSIFIGVAHAVAFAHHRGIVHQDIKPDNIMLGGFGEILLVDWGSASRLDDAAPRLYGTPLYMSPEQARLERADRQSDIYCLGATLFHALTLRFPIWSDDPEEFWRKKRSGTIDLPTAAERAAIPAPLLAIALKAIEPAPASRYATIESFIEDLAHYQAGLAVSAHRDTLRERWARWYRMHRRGLWSGLAVGVVIVALIALLYGERLKEIATWGEPVVEQTFSDDGWKAWPVTGGSFTATNGRLVTGGKRESVIICPHMNWGDTAIEYVAEILPDSTPGDLSLLWITDIDLATQAEDAVERPGTYRFQIGMNDNSFTAITTDARVYLAYSDFRPEPGRRYRFRAEIVDNHLTLMVDGRRICEYDAPMPFNGGYAGFYGYYPGKAFDNLRIYTRGIPQKVAATAIGDSYMQNHLFAQAREQFAKVVATHRGEAIGDEALYKQGLCSYRLGRHDEAFTLWRGLDGTDFGETVWLHRFDQRFEDDQHVDLLREMEDLHGRARTVTRVRIAMQWSAYVRRLVERSQTGNLATVLTDYLTLRDRLFPNENTTDRSAADALLVLGRFQEILDRFPHQAEPGARALACQGREEEVLVRMSAKPAFCQDALRGMGRINESIRHFGGDNEAVNQLALADFESALAWHVGNFEVLIRSGKFQEAVDSKRAAGRWNRDRLAIFRKRIDDIPASEQLDNVAVLMAQKRFDEAMQRYCTNFSYGMWPRHALGLDAWIRGNTAEAERCFTVPDSWEFHQKEFFLAHYVVVPFLHELAGDHEAMARSFALFDHQRRYIYQQQPWHCVQFLMGRIGEAEFLGQPFRTYAAGLLPLCQAIAAERVGRTSEASASYRAYLDVPAWRRSDNYDPVIERFASWRLSELDARR